jgi:hypothetical protein
MIYMGWWFPREGSHLPQTLTKESKMLSNEIFALECIERYKAQGLTVDEKNGEFAHCPLPERYGDKGYYLLHGDHQHQGLLQSKDINECCFFSGDTKRWLENFGPSLEIYEELWEIYQEYSKRANEKMHKEKNVEGKSLGAIKAAKRLHEMKNKEGKSIWALKHNEKIHSLKNEEGKSINAVNMSKKSHERKNEEGKSVNAVEAGKKAAEKLHEAKNEEGKSIHAINMSKKSHEAKDGNGKSLLAIKNSKKAHEVKDENGKSLLGLKNAKRLNAQIWESTVDGFRSTASAVSKHNRANGWDPGARIRINQGDKL